MKQTKITDFKYNKPSFFNTLLVHKKTSFFHKIYYSLIDFKLFYKYKKRLKYSSISLSGEIIDFSLIIFFTEIIGLFYLLSALLSYLLALVNNFFLNLKFTFKYKPKNYLDFFGSFVNYILVSLFGLILNLLVIGFLVEIFSLNYLVAKIIASFIIFSLVYSGHNFVLGRKEIKLHK